MPTDIYALVVAKRDEILAVAERYGITNVASSAPSPAARPATSTCS